jgi:hypothetical protein
MRISWNVGTKIELTVKLHPIVDSDKAHGP